MITENGWPSCGPDQLDSSPIPGTGTDDVALQQGQPSIILKAFGADLNWYVESANNAWGYADEGGWTPTNIVATSNHLGGTAMDYNWNDHPLGPQAPDPAAGWEWSEIVGGPEDSRVRELLAYYEGTVYWGNDWDSPHDSMHFQMGYNTYGNPATQDFINRKIDPSTGFSHFRDTKGTAAAAVDLTQLLAQAMMQTNGVDYSQYVSGVSACLLQCGCDNVDRISMWCAQVGEESAGLRYMEEIADGSEYEGRTDLGNTQPGDGPRFKGRGPIQITGRLHYTDLSLWAFQNGLVPTPTFFVDDPEQLATPVYGFIGVTWYWTVARPTLNAAADAKDVTEATLLVNGGNHGLPDRQNRFNNCEAMGQRLMELVSGDDDPLSDPAVVQMLTDLHNMFCGDVASQSRYKTDGEGAVWTRGQMVQNDDGMEHETWVERLAILGDPANVALVARNTARDDAIAASVLIRIDDKYLTADQRTLKQTVLTQRFPTTTGTGNV
jgi:putative chitinase